MRQIFLQQLLVGLFGLSNLLCIQSSVVCPGKNPSDYCDCKGDCENYPDYCECDEAQICCGNINPSPTNPSPADPAPSPISHPGSFTPILYSDGTGLFRNCKKTTQVFSVTICYTRKAWDDGDKDKIDHIAHVLAQLIDNNADGEIDDPDLISYIVNNGFLFVPYDEDDRYVVKKFHLIM